MKKAICLAVSFVFIVAGIILSLSGISVSAGTGPGEKIGSPAEFASLIDRFTYNVKSDGGREYGSAAMYDRMHLSVEKTSFDRIMTVYRTESGALYSVTAVIKDGAKNVHLLIDFDMITDGEKVFLKLNKYEDFSGKEQNEIIQSSITGNCGKWMDMTDKGFDRNEAEPSSSVSQSDLDVYTAVNALSDGLSETVESACDMSGSELALISGLLRENGKDGEYLTESGGVYKLTEAGQRKLLDGLYVPEGSGSFTLGLNLIDPTRPKLRYSATFEPISEGSGSVVRIDETLEFYGVGNTRFNKNVPVMSVYAWMGDAVKESLRDREQIR